MDSTRKKRKKGMVTIYLPDLKNAKVHSFARLSIGIWPKFSFSLCNNGTNCHKKGRIFDCVKHNSTVHVQGNSNVLKRNHIYSNRGTAEGTEVHGKKEIYI
jgi:hypothetical protein